MRYLYRPLPGVSKLVPDELMAAITPANSDPGRGALEAMALEAFRERQITAYQLRLMPGIPSRFELDGFLKQHEVETYTAEDFEHDLANAVADTTPVNYLIPIDAIGVLEPLYKAVVISETF